MRSSTTPRKSDFVTPLICWVKGMHTQNEEFLQIAETHPAKIDINGHCGHAELPFFMDSKNSKNLPLFYRVQKVQVLPAFFRCQICQILARVSVCQICQNP